MTEAEFLAYRPTLLHVALRKNWLLIRRYGLLSTSALLDLAHPDQRSRRSSLEAARRPSICELKLHDGSTAYLRDNATISDKHLAKLLTGGTSAKEWYRELNRRVFFWVKRDEPTAFMVHYRDHPQVLLVADAKRVLDAHREKVRLTRINTGLTRQNMKRGRESFERFDTVRGPADVREFTVEGSIANLAALGFEAYAVDGGICGEKLDL